MRKLTDFLLHVREQRLEAVADEFLRLAIAMRVPLQVLLAQWPGHDRKAWALSVVTELTDPAVAATKNSWLRRWQNESAEGIRKKDLHHADMLLLFAAQKALLLHYLPGFTEDFKASMALVEAIDERLHAAQCDAFDVVFGKEAVDDELERLNEFLNTVQENIPDMIFVKEAENLRFVSFNKAGEDLLGYAREDLIGKNDYDFFPKEQADFFTGKDREVLKRGLVYDIPEEPIETAKGEKRWLHTKKIPVFGKDNKPRFLVGISEDITERKKIADEVRKWNERFFKILNLSPIAIYLTHVETGRFIYVNKAFRGIFRLESADVVGKTVFELGLIDQESREKLTGMVKQRGGRMEAIEMPLRLGDGTVHAMLVSSELIEMDNGPCYLCTALDISDRKEAEEKIMGLNETLNRNVQQLDSVNKELEAFCYSVSHDLRAPLRAINGYARMIEEDCKPELNEEAKRLLNSIHYNAQKMGRLIDDLLQFSRLGKKEIDRSEENMNELVENVLIELSRNVKHDADIRVAKLHPARIDYGLIHQAVYNLIDNAIKYSSKSEKPVIEIRSEKRKGEIEYSISDNGVGFDMRYVNKLFGVFQRLHNMQDFEGTGVGLAIVQRIVAKHGGRVWAKGEIGKGASFFFTLPS